MAKLKEVCTFYSGTGFPTKYQGNDEGEYAFYKVSDIANNVQLGNTYLSVCNNYISGEIAKEIKGCILPKDTVVFAKIGEAVKLNRRAITSADCLIDNNAMGLAPIQDKLRLDYFFYYMRNLKMEKLAESTTVPSVRKSLLEELEIKVPSLEEQKEIGEILDKVSVVIQTRKQEIEQLDLLIKARFVEMFYEKGYPVLKWNDVFITTTGKLDSNASVEKGAYPFFTCSKELLRIDTYAFDQEALLLAGNNAAGKYDVKYYAGKFNAYQRTYVLSLKENWSYRLFQYQLEDKLEYLQQQSLGGLTKYLTLKILGELEFVIPPEELQSEFEIFVTQVTKSKVAVQKALNETQILFDSLMQEYFG
jgi:type I restriction enzyme S subunit